ncbi:MAG: ribose-phosphate pyrophosphokinase [Deltaproteobacteria bacterium]|nr:ribose-phosphate pyrophosphokinase [Deltaproteobacteria bacterium]MBW2255569.1 ribose-phosphate pyrophosphokinase [Deltaproteobacteria bacterium]
MYGEMVLFTGNANPALAKRIAERLGHPISSAKVGRFSDGETRVELHQNVRGRDVFLLQPTCAPVNDSLMELLIMAEACRRSSAGRVTAVMPYFGYARQDRKVAPRAPITARLVADLFQAVAIDRVLTMDLHAGQIQGFFNIPVDNLYAQPILYRFMKEELLAPDTIIVSPDAGGTERARSYAKRLHTGLAIIDKRRSGPNESEVLNIVGDVKGMRAIIIDDMIDTAGTLTKGGTAVAEAGAKVVIAVATHAVLSGPALSRLEESVFEKVVVTDSIPLQDSAKASPKIRTLSVASVFAEAIRSIHFNDSISRLFLDDED